MSDANSGSVRGLDVPAVTRWMKQNVASAEGELSFHLVAAGGSNLTYRVESSSGHRFALRRPPERARIATAHDMSREWKIMAALDAHPECGVPVPAALAYCDDPSILGAEFYVMAFAEGRILRGPAEAADMDTARCRRAADSLIDVQVAMHTLDADAVGLGDLGRRDAYVERQLSRWLRQYEAA
ncbi:phosphotransferase family protein, partial [Myxococcota bacterium]|nr:phosphotransferase family protein [Myxococcota bacterium]